MSNKNELASTIIDLVGGKENVSDVLHCMTRLRFRLKDESLAKIDEIKNVNGVLGIQQNIGELQIIIGPSVAKLYQEVVDIGGFTAKDIISEVTDDNPDQKNPIQKFGMKLFEVLTGCITPCIPAFVLMGMLNMLMAVLGPTLLGVISAESDLYVLLQLMAGAVTYFLPFLLAFSASRKLGANTIISLVLAGILMSPMIQAMVTNGQSFTVYGIPMTLVDYSSSFLPMLLIVFAQTYVEKLVMKIIPDIVKTAFVPVVTILIMAPIALCILGPVGQFLGQGLANVIIALSEQAGFLEGALVAALYPFLVAFGMGGPIFLATFAIYMQTGTDFLYFPFMCVYNMCIMGVAIGYIIKSKSADDKQVGIVALSSQALGSVSEPTIYGILFKSKTCLFIEVIAAALGGFYIGLTHAAVIVLGGVPLIGNYLMFMGLNNMNFINGAIGITISFVLALVGTLVFYKGDNR